MACMLDFHRVEDLRLHFAGQQHPDRVLAAGVHPLGGVDWPQHAAEPAPLTLHIDRRGIWLRVDPQARGVHVNGRPVHRLALLRAGDSLHAEGVDMLLVGQVRALPQAGQGPGISPPDLRRLLRAHGGRHHGRSFTLERERLVGAGAAADIAIDETGAAGVQARIGPADGAVVLRDLGQGTTVRVNGVVVREALLEAGDQVVFAGRHRFVVEGAPLPMAHAAEEVAANTTTPLADRRNGGRRLPWLLLTALLIALALAALLLL